MAGAHCRTRGRQTVGSTALPLGTATTVGVRREGVGERISRRQAWLAYNTAAAAVSLADSKSDSDTARTAPAIPRPDPALKLLPLAAASAHRVGTLPAECRVSAREALAGRRCRATRGEKATQTPFGAAPVQQRNPDDDKLPRNPTAAPEPADRSRDPA